MRPRWRAFSQKPGRTSNRVVCGRKFCSSCGRWRHVVDFPHYSKRKTGYSYCVACVRRKARERYARLTPAQMEARREVGRFTAERIRRARGIEPRRFKHKRTVIDRREGVYLPLEPLLSEMNGYADAELALLSGVPERSIFRVRHQNKRVQIDVADRLAVALGVPLAVLYPEDR